METADHATGGSDIHILQGEYSVFEICTLLPVPIFIDIILSAALWCRDRLTNRNKFQEYFLGMKAARAKGL
jgi:hypothetical protein